MSVTDDLATVSEALADDLGLSGDVDDYPDPTPPAPVPEGNYRLRLEIGLDKDDSGKVRGLTDEAGKFYPTILITKGEVVEGPEGTEGRSAVSYERVYTKPYPRGTGMANGLSDLTRSFDQTRGFSNFNDGFELLSELAQNETMRCRVRWEAFDSDYFDERVKAVAGSRENLTKEQKKMLNKECSIRGQKNFEPNGTVKGPSGAVLTARARISSFYPSGDEKVKVG